MKSRAMVRATIALASFLLISLLFLSTSLPVSQAQSTPLYARSGAYAFYDVQGGAVAFFNGVQGNISYTVIGVFTNGSMSVRMGVNISEGDEIAPSAQIFNYTDSIGNPKFFPVVPLSELGSTTITFENTTMSYVKTTQQTVGAGTFETLEYQGTSNGTTVSFYFDNNTGLAINELSGDGSIISLESSNVATPISVPDPTTNDLPYILIFVIIFALAGVGYFEISRYYAKQARRDFKKKLKKERKRINEETQ
ncbi:MAG TPA: hypothetical protein VJN71_07970 [Nitrososphaerales archaeon]|nr:hypothetical protein [Nitrososphaerales archaeon]